MYTVNLKAYYYNNILDDYFRIVKFNQDKRYPYKIEWYFKEEENGNNVTDAWFELPASEMEVTFTTKEIRSRPRNENAPKGYVYNLQGLI